MHSPGPLAAVVLTGGRSARMGQDKAWLPFGPETLLERIVRIVRASTPDIVLAAGRDQPLPASLADLPVRRDPGAPRGPLAAFVNALEGLGTELVFLTACDMPLLRDCLIPALAERCEGWEAAVPIVDNRRLPTCGVYRTDALRARAEAFGDPRDGSLQAFIAALRVHEVAAAALHACDPDRLSFTPCNTPEEYRRALDLAGLPVNDGLPPAV